MNAKVGLTIRPMNATTSVAKSASEGIYVSPSAAESGMTSAEEVHEFMSSIKKSSSFEEELDQMECFLTGMSRI